MFWLKWIVVGIIILAVLGGSLKILGAWRWHVGAKALLARLEVSRSQGMYSPYHLAEIEGLPAPVQRYFRMALTDGQPKVSALTLTQSGTFNMNEARPSWKQFTASQRVTTRRPGFLWDARINMFPGFPVHVHDAYIGGEGILHAALLGVFTLADLKGGRDAAEGELMRYLPEAAWYPTALLPRYGIAWQAINETSALATISDGERHVSMTFHFNSKGLIDTVHSKARSRLLDGKVTMLPWQCRFKNYMAKKGMMVPLYGEVEWLTPQGPKLYFRGTVTSLVYELAS